MKILHSHLISNSVSVSDGYGSIEPESGSEKSNQLLIEILRGFIE